MAFCGWIGLLFGLVQGSIVCPMNMEYGLPENFNLQKWIALCRTGKWLDANIFRFLDRFLLLVFASLGLKSQKTHNLIAFITYRKNPRLPHLQIHEFHSYKWPTYIYIVIIKLLSPSSNVTIWFYTLSDYFI